MHYYSYQRPEPALRRSTEFLNDSIQISDSSNIPQYSQQNAVIVYVGATTNTCAALEEYVGCDMDIEYEGDFI